jgi:hypothetical protein
MILFAFTPGGGFTVGDTESGITAHAGATWWFARRARTKPESTAVAMLAYENPRIERRAYDKQNWLALCSVRFPVDTNGVVHLPASAIVES